MGQESYTRLYKALHGKAELEVSDLKKYLERKKIHTISTPVISVTNKKELQTLPLQTSSNGLKTGFYVAGVNKHVLPAMQQHLKLKAYSSSTIKTYINEMSQLLQTLNNIPADELKPEHLKRYLVYCFEKLKLKKKSQCHCRH